MNKKQILAIIGIVVCCLSSCQRDDLCVPEELDIPRLVIVFVDARNQLVRKPVEQLQVFEVNDSIALPLNNQGLTLLREVDSIAIPLRIDQDITQLEFVQTIENTTINRDLVDIIYTQEAAYINRACGFKPTYDNLVIERQNNAAATSWINTFIVRNTTVTTNTDIHVEIRH